MSEIHKIQFLVLIIVLLFCTIIGKRMYAVMDVAMKIFYILIVITFINELLSFVLFLQVISRSLLSHLYSILELSLTGIYFLLCLGIKKIKTSTFLIIIFSLALGLSNIFLLQSLNTYNSYMLMVESFIIIAMSMYVFFFFLKNDELLDVLSNPHFKIWVGLLIMWSSTFFFWGFLFYLQNINPKYLSVIYSCQSLLNTLVYAYFGYTFYTIGRDYKRTIGFSRLGSN